MAPTRWSQCGWSPSSKRRNVQMAVREGCGGPGTPSLPGPEKEFAFEVENFCSVLSRV